MTAGYHEQLASGRMTSERLLDASISAKAIQEREREARQQLVTRSNVDYADLVTTYRTLRALGEINLDDLKVAPGFNLLADGEVGSVNCDTPEWLFWSALSRLAADADYLARELLRAESELKVAGHWDDAAAGGAR
ncbi:hypothetical protein [Mycolicibacterium sp. A43C]